MEFKITAHNPKGLDYDVVRDTLEQAKNSIRIIVRQGGEKITLNGVEVPQSLLDTL